MESLFKRVNPIRKLRWSKRARLSNGVQRILSLRKQGSRGLIYQARSQGITLIELMIALGLSTVVAGAIIGIMSTGTRIWKMSTTQLTAFQSEQVMLDRMKKELEEASKIHGAEWGSIAFYRQGYSITPLSSSLASGLTSDDPYSDNWKGKIHDIVWYYYSETVEGKGAVWRKVTDGYTPSVVVSNPVIISDPNTDIKRLKFLYFNYGNYLTWLERTEPPPPPLDLYSPGVRPPPYKKVIDCNISPYYPQNIFLGNEIAWVKGTLGDDVQLQSRSYSPSATPIWWDDGGDLSGDGNKSWTALSTDLVKFNPWSGKQAIKLSDSLPDEPDGGTGSLVLTGKSVPAGSDTLLKTTVAGSMSLTTQPAAATQLEITLGAKTKVISGKLEASEGSGKIIISGTTVENGAGDSETLETSACGVPFTTTKRFSNVTGITTSGLTDEKFSDETSAIPYITIVDPKKSVWIFTHVLLGTSYSTPKVVLLQFKTGTTWKGAYWSEVRQDPALDKSEDAVNFGLIPKMADGTRGVDGVNRVYMGPLPEPGGWTVLGVPAAAAGVSLEGASISGVDPNVALTIYNGLAYFDKAEVGTFSGWYGTTGLGGVYSNAGGEAITSPNAQFIQYKAILEATVSNPSPVMSESSLEHGCGGNKWVVTSSADSPGNDRWKAGSLNNVIAGEGDIKLFQWNINYGIDGILLPQSYDMSGWAQRYEFTLPTRRFVRDKVLLTIDSADPFDASTIRVALLKENNVDLQLVPFEQVTTGSLTSHKIYVISTNGEAGGGTQGSVNWSTSGGRLYVYYGGPGAIPPGPAYSDDNFTTAFGTSVHGGTGIGQHPYDTCYLPVSVTGTKQLKANYGTYLSQPYCAPAHSIWTLPYTADAYDVRVHFTYFKTQTGDKNDTLGIYNVNSCTGLSYAAGEIIPTPTVDGLYGDTPLWLIADTSGAIMKGTGYRTRWLLSGYDGESPNPIPPSEILLAGGAKFSFIFTAPLGYNLTCDDGWMIDRYECWTAMNPTLIQVDLTAQAGKGRNERAKTLSTKVQPPNLLFR